MKLRTMASAMPFAHLLGLGVVAAHAAQEEDDRAQRADESDDDYAKRMEEEHEKDKAKKAEQDKKDEDARRAEKDDDEEDDKDEKTKAARARERVRCAAIVAAGMKAGITKQACVFAFDTSLSAAQAIAALGAAQLDAPIASAAAKPRTPSIDERMARVPNHNPGASAPAVQEPTMAQKIIAAGKKRRGEA